VKGQQQEKRAQNVLALRHPRHRLDVQGMCSEERGDDAAAPERAGGETQPEEEQHGIEDVKEHAHEQVRTGIGAEERDVELVRQPRHRVPVGGVNARKGPANAGRGQAAEDVGIVGDVERIVVIDELMGADLGVNGQDDDRQRRADGSETQMRAVVVALFHGNRGRSNGETRLVF
jgi:hypothetical protein